MFNKKKATVVEILSIWHQVFFTTVEFLEHFYHFMDGEVKLAVLP